MENIPESSSSSKGTKRRRDEEESGDGNTASLELDLTFSDTLVALRIMRAQFPHIPKVSVEPFILKSQLYSSVKDRTLVDRELETLRRDKVLRVFKLNTGQDDHAVMFLDDYINQIVLLKELKEKKEGKTKFFNGSRLMFWIQSWKLELNIRSFAHSCHSGERLRIVTSPF